MAWIVEYDPRAIKDLEDLDRPVRKEILDYMDQRVGAADDPRAFGKPLKGSRFGLWRYRVRDYRIVCQIQDGRLTVLVVAVGHRRSVYET